MPPIFFYHERPYATLQLLLELGNPPDSLQLSVPLREAAQKFDVTDYRKLQDSIVQDLQNNPAGEGGLAAFSFLTRVFTVFQILSAEDPAPVLNILEQKLASPRANLDQEFWQGVHNITGAVSDRIRRRISLEAFEDAVGEVNWGSLASDPEWMSTVSGLIGLVYLREEADQAGKAPVWLDQAIKAGNDVHTLVYQYAKSRYAMDRERGKEGEEKYTGNLQIEQASGTLAKAYRLAELELKVRLMYYHLTYFPGRPVR